MHTRYLEEHDWSTSDISETLAEYAGNFANAGGDSPDGWDRGRYRENIAHWDINLQTPSDRDQRYRFMTHTEAAGGSNGETIAVTASEALFSDDSGGIFSDDETDAISLEWTFTYGDTEAG